MNARYPVDCLNRSITAAQDDRVHYLGKAIVKGIGYSQMTKPGGRIGKDELKLPSGQLIKCRLFHLSESSSKQLAACEPFPLLHFYRQFSPGLSARKLGVH
jgi:hypothetical protein